jgi:cell division topological specificity factor
MGWLNKLFHLDIPKSNNTIESKTGDSTSKNTACNRLKLVLMHDRTQLSPSILEKMRDELVEVISKYVEIDQNALELNLESESNTIALVANIPVLRSRTS